MYQNNRNEISHIFFTLFLFLKHNLSKIYVSVRSVQKYLVCMSIDVSKAYESILNGMHVPWHASFNTTTNVRICTQNYGNISQMATNALD